MDKEQLATAGAEIRRLRTERPKISQERLAEEAGIAPNTLASVERGQATDDSLTRVIQAMGRLGRPVEVVFPEAEVAPVEVPDRKAVDIIGDLVTAILRAAPPEEVAELETNIWLLVRGRSDELIARLNRSSRETNG